MTLPYLESYDGQTTDELLALEGKYRIDSLVGRFEDALLAKDNPTPDEMVIIAVEALEREVNNGGYSQFFINSSVDHAGIVVQALHAIDCPKTADITRDAIRAIAPDGDLTPSFLEAAAVNAGDDLQARLHACDDRYFANDEPIADRLFDWIKANRAAIRVGKS